MATSSIFANVVIKNERDAIRLINACEASEREESAEQYNVRPISPDSIEHYKKMLERVREQRCVEVIWGQDG